MSEATKIPSDRRQHIIDVSITCFSRTGYHNTSMTDIADAVGVTKPVLYQHFDSKRALYLEILRFVGQALVTAVTSNAATSSDGREQTERAMIAYFTWVNEHRDAFALLFESSERVDEEFATTVREFEEAASSAIAPLITVDLPEDSRRTLAMALVGMVEAVSRHVIAQGTPFDSGALGTELAGLAWGGLRSLGQSRNTQPR
jgi:AcrR family transcriptional regulator